jgi:FtsP/CotA-like multicopper oxidase with cupredoxin domain
VAWNYAPAGTNVFTGAPFDDEANKFVHAGPDRIGSTHTKCLYHAYTDASFTQQIPRPADQQYLGLLGPVIRAQVGDTVTVTFRNNCSFPASIHPHGVFYQKKDEGAPYNDGRSAADKAGDAVAPHQQYVYTWEVPDRAGPGPMDGSSVMWMYHSHTDEIPDVYSGLMGPIEITARGKARPDGSPNDVDREFFALFMVDDENQSHYLEAERTKLAKPPAADDADFQESNKMHSINGYVYADGPAMTMRQGQRVRWYVMSMGNEVDLHTPHWHGNTVTANGMRTDTVSLLPATMITADMVPDEPGMWGFHCHVSDHILAGMLARYEVLPAQSQ